MVQPVMSFGHADGLHFELEWDSAHPEGSAADSTRGRLLVRIAGRLVWGVWHQDKPQGFHWTWVELIEFLAESWPRLEWEETNPLGIPALNPGDMMDRARSRWSQMPAARRVEEEEALWAFQEAHDLSRALQGAWPESLWVLREGLFVGLYARNLRVLRPTQEVIGSLSALGDAICSRLATSEDARAKAVIQEWAGRTRHSQEELVSVATGFPSELVHLIAGKDSIEHVWELSKNEFKETELLAAARMVGRERGATMLQHVMRLIRSQPSVKTPALDNMAYRAQEHLAKFSSDLSCDQAYVIAQWFRGQPGVVDQAGRVDPEHILREWGVRIVDKDLVEPSLDAISCWGPQHGPAIIVNKSGCHAQGRAGRRATLAHEIVHLLIDRANSLPLAEVLGGGTPPAVEVRARAFAAETLLPRECAGRTVATAPDPMQAVRSLQMKYGVSREIVAWQVRNSTIPLQPATFVQLKALVSDPANF